MVLSFGPANFGYAPDGTFKARYYSDKAEPWVALESIEGNELVSTEGDSILSIQDANKSSEELS